VISPSLRTTGKSVDTLKQFCCHINSTSRENNDRQGILHTRIIPENEYLQDMNQNVVFTMQYLKQHDVCRSPLYHADHSHDWFACIRTPPMNAQRLSLVQPHFCKMQAFLFSLLFSLRCVRSPAVIRVLCPRANRSCFLLHTIVRVCTLPLTACALLSVHEVE